MSAFCMRIPNRQYESEAFHVNAEGSDEYYSCFNSFVARSRVDGSQ